MIVASCVFPATLLAPKRRRDITPDLIGEELLVAHHVLRAAYCVLAHDYGPEHLVDQPHLIPSSSLAPRMIFGMTLEEGISELLPEVERSLEDSAFTYSELCVDGEADLLWD